jgi:hypothetical protein
MGLALLAVGTWLTAEPEAPAVSAKVQEQAAALIQRVRDGAEGSNAHIEQVAAAIDALGNDGAVVLREALRNAQGHERRDLVRALWRSRRPEAVKGVVLEILTGDPDEAVRRSAKSLLLDSTLRRPVLPEEFQALIREVETEPTFSAGGYARVSAGCVGMTPEQKREVTRAIVARLAKEAAAPSDAKKQGAPGGSYVTQEVVELNQYTLALRRMRDPSAVEFLQERLKNAGENARLRKWLVIALGFSGYAPVGPELKAILEDDSDLSTRVEAMSAYAAAIGPAAIPMLEAYTNDTTTLFPGGGGNPMRTKYPLRGVARDELVDLRKMAK